jgi:hypothetical protein
MSTRANRAKRACLHGRCGGEDQVERHTPR